MNSFYQWICFVLVLGPPRRSGQVETQQIVKEGETVKLNCPVVGDPKPTLEWTKDREAINSAWTRFRRLPTGLRIKDVALEDAGDYVCKGINGFGTVDIYYTLYVLGKCNFVHFSMLYSI